jgi:hypothetical protein
MKKLSEILEIILKFTKILEKKSKKLLRNFYFFKIIFIQ